MMEGDMSEREANCYEQVADCQLRAATDLFAHTWDPVVLAALSPGPRRRRELRASIGGISDKALIARRTPRPRLASSTA
jgi:DNA-binding HxlR family transcriptional regulator